jgi:hypothetical protein
VNRLLLSARTYQDTYSASRLQGQRERGRKKTTTAKALGLQRRDVQRLSTIPVRTMAIARVPGSCDITLEVRTRVLYTCTYCTIVWWRGLRFKP